MYTCKVIICIYYFLSNTHRASTNAYQFHFAHANLITKMIILVRN